MSPNVEPLPFPAPELASSTAQSDNEFDTAATGRTSAIPSRPATGSGKGATAAFATRSQKKPGDKKAKPFRPSGYYWRDNSGGWQLRKSGRDGDPDKDRYVAHLGAATYAEMKRKYSGQALNDAIARWVVIQTEKKVAGS